MDQFTIKGKVICDTEINGQPISNNSLGGMGAVEDWQAFTDAQDDSIDSIKNNNALMKEFGNIMPEILKNFRTMNDIVARTNQNLPAIGQVKSSEDLRLKQIDNYSRQNFLQLVNSGSNAVQSVANANMSGAVLGGVNSIAGTANNLSKMAEASDMASLAKGLVAGGVIATVAAAVIKGGDALASKYIESMPTIYGTGKSFNSLSDGEALAAYNAINGYNNGTGLDVDTFQGLAQSLRKQGVGNNLGTPGALSLVGSIAQTTGRWAYATGGDVNQYANLAGLMSRYGGSGDVSSDFNYLVAAGKASGLNNSQIPEFLSGIQKVMEDGISKGFTRSATDVADTLLMFSKMSGNNAFWQGEQGVKLLNQMNSGLAGSTGLSKTTDILAYRAISQAYNGKQSSALGDLYLADGGYVNNMMLLEQGLNKNNFGSVMDAIASSTTSKEGQIERIREMFGVNYTGASRILQLYSKKGGSVTDTDIRTITEAPENQNDETKYQQAINDIKTAVVNIGQGAAELKIKSMGLITGPLGAIAQKVAGYTTTNTSILLGESADNNSNVLSANVTDGSVGDHALFGYKVSDGPVWEMKKIIGRNNTKAIDEYLRRDEYGNKILELSNGSSEEANSFLQFLLNNKEASDLRGQVNEETSDYIVYQEERDATKKLLEQMYQIYSLLKDGITLTEQK